MGSHDETLGGMGRKGEEGAEVCLMPRGAVTVRCNRMFLVYGLGRREDSEAEERKSLSAEKYADKITLK